MHTIIIWNTTVCIIQNAGKWVKNLYELIPRRLTFNHSCDSILVTLCLTVLLYAVYHLHLLCMVSYANLSKLRWSTSLCPALGIFVISSFPALANKCRIYQITYSTLPWWVRGVTENGINSSPLDKIAAISQTTFANAFSSMFSILISLSFVPKSSIDNNTALF